MKQPSLLAVEQAMMGLTEGASPTIEVHAVDGSLRGWFGWLSNPAGLSDDVFGMDPLDVI
jgi:hypothetical protein